MYIVEIETRGWDTQYVSNFSYRGYDHISDLQSTPVRERAWQFADRAQADDAKACVERLNGPRSVAAVVEL